MGERATEHVRAAFGIEEVVDSWETLYQELYGARFGEGAERLSSGRT